jgi:hypothetical protein
MRIPVKLLVFLSVAGLYYGFVLPKKAAYTHDLLKTFGGGPHSREDSTKALVEARIRAEICPQADLSGRERRRLRIGSPATRRSGNSFSGSATAWSRRL